MAGAKLVLLLACALVLLLALATAVNAAGPKPKPEDPKPKPKPEGPKPKPKPEGPKLKPKRVRCQSRKYFPGCNNFMVCPEHCPRSCYVDCNTCKPVCVCNAPGAVCYDPRFIGGDGISFYFHGRKNDNFCLMSDSDLHINAHFIGKRNANMTRDFTWVQSVAVLFGSGHRLYVGAEKTATWDDDVDRLSITFDGEPVQLHPEEGATWRSSTSPAVSVVRTSGTNALVVEIEGELRMTSNVVPITAEDSRVHNYGVNSDDCLAHLELGFKFYSLSDDVHGVLGQTFRQDYVSRMDVTKAMPVMGGADTFSTSDIFAADCSVSRFGSETGSLLALPSSEKEEVKCSSDISGRGIVCKK